MSMSAVLRHYCAVVYSLALPAKTNRTKMRRRNPIRRRNMLGQSDQSRSFLAHSCVIEQLRQKRAHVARLVEMAVDALRAATDRKRQPVHVGHNRKHRLISDVVADEQRTAALERLVRHQFLHAGSLGETGVLYFANRLAGQHLDWRIGQVSAD